MRLHGIPCPRDPERLTECLVHESDMTYASERITEVFGIRAALGESVLTCTPSLAYSSSENDCTQKGLLYGGNMDCWLYGSREGCPGRRRSLLQSGSSGVFTARECTLAPPRLHPPPSVDTSPSGSHNDPPPVPLRSAVVSRVLLAGADDQAAQRRVEQAIGTLRDASDAVFPGFLSRGASVELVVETLDGGRFTLGVPGTPAPPAGDAAPGAEVPGPGGDPSQGGGAGTAVLAKGTLSSWGPITAMVCGCFCVAGGILFSRQARRHGLRAAASRATCGLVRSRPWGDPGEFAGCVVVEEEWDGAPVLVFPCEAREMVPVAMERGAGGAVAVLGDGEPGPPAHARVGHPDRPSWAGAGVTTAPGLSPPAGTRLALDGKGAVLGVLAPAAEPDEERGRRPPDPVPATAKSPGGARTPGGETWELSEAGGSSREEALHHGGPFRRTGWLGSGWGRRRRDAGDDSATAGASGGAGPSSPGGAGAGDGGVRAFWGLARGFGALWETDGGMLPRARGLARGGAAGERPARDPGGGPGTLSASRSFDVF